jgi:hypothetical protein
MRVVAAWGVPRREAHLAAHVDHAVVELAVVLGELDLGVEQRGEVREEPVLHGHRKPEDPVEELLHRRLGLRAQVDRDEGFIGIVEVLCPPLPQAGQPQIERLPHVLVRGLVLRRAARHLGKQLLQCLLPPLGVHVEGAQVGGVGGAAVALGDGAQRLVRVTVGLE